MANSMFQWLTIGLLALLHPFFVSVIEINHNAKEKSVEVSMRIFTDDFEGALKKFSNTKVDLANPANKEAIDKIIVSYIKQKMYLQIDGKPVLLEYVGYEIKKESVWLYFEIDNIATLKKVQVNCNLLYECQEKQMNIFHVNANGKEKSYKLDNPATTTSFDF
jgi:hypothetical protein